MHALTSSLARAVVLFSMAAPVAVSQTPLFFQVPAPATQVTPFTTNNLPFAGGPMRYQQVYRDVVAARTPQAPELAAKR